MHAYNTYLFKEGRPLSHKFQLALTVTFMSIDDDMKLFIKEYSHCRQITRLSLVIHTGSPIVRGNSMHVADNYHINNLLPVETGSPIVRGIGMHAYSYKSYIII